MDLQGTKRKCRRVLLSHRHQQTDTVIFILFSCTKHCIFHCVFSLCTFHVSFYHSHSKANGVNLTILLCKRFSTHHYNVQTATAEKKKQQLSNNNIYLISKMWLFPLRSNLKQGLLRYKQNTWKMPVMGFIFLAKLQAGCLQLYHIFLIKMNKVYILRSAYLI